MRWASGGYRYKLLREGQAEVIGGLIAISVLLFSIAAIILPNDINPKLILNRVRTKNII